MPLSNRFEDALVYAACLHSRQVRKGSSTPYVSHLLGVASIALEYGANEDEAIAALLHDAVEDQGGAARLEDIRQHFGDAVAEIVAGCSDSMVTPKPPWKERKETYLNHLAQTSPSIRLVSCADKLYNARSVLKDYRALGDELWPRFHGGRDGTLWYFRRLVEEYRNADHTSALVDELDRVVTELENMVYR